MNGGHVHTLEDLWMGRITVRHLEPGVFTSQNHLLDDNKCWGCNLHSQKDASENREMFKRFIWLKFSSFGSKFITCCFKLLFWSFDNSNQLLHFNLFQRNQTSNFRSVLFLELYDSLSDSISTRNIS